VSAGSPNYFDLEDPASLSRLEEPMTALSRLRGTVVIDEVQRRPDLFPVLRVLADRQPLPARFLVLGSASPELLRQSAESLAGRLEVIPLSGFSLGEVGAGSLGRLWLRGGFPPSYLARSAGDSLTWRRELVRTFLERDLPQLGVTIPSAALLRFWSVLAHHHGGVWNAAGRRLGVEVKRTDGPQVTPSMRAALHDLRLDQLVVLYPGETSYALGDHVSVRPLEAVAEGAAGLFPRSRR